MDNTLLFRFVDDGLLWLRAYVMGTLARLVYYGSDTHANYVANATGATVTRIQAPSEEGVSMEVWDFGYGKVAVFMGSVTRQLFWQYGGAFQVADPLFPGQVMSYYAAQAPQHWELLSPHIPQDGAKPVILVGHSYGGGLCQLVAHLLARHRPEGTLRGVYSYASPRVGNPAYVAGSNFHHFRFANQEDIIPRLPPESTGVFIVPQNPLVPNLNWARFAHHGRGFVMNEQGEVRSDALGFLPATTAHTPLFEDFGLFGVGSIQADHFMASHLWRIRGRFKTRQGDRFNWFDLINNEINAEENLGWGFPLTS